MAPLTSAQEIAATLARGAGQPAQNGYLFRGVVGWLESQISEMYGEAVPSE
jgi:hypothetical protein